MPGERGTSRAFLQDAEAGHGLCARARDGGLGHRELEYRDLARPLDEGGEVYRETIVEAAKLRTTWSSSTLRCELGRVVRRGQVEVILTSDQARAQARERVGG